MAQDLTVLRVGFGALFTSISDAQQIPDLFAIDFDERYLHFEGPPAAFQLRFAFCNLLYSSRDDTSAGEEQ